jgi:hypothetical protein
MPQKRKAPGLQPAGLNEEKRVTRFFSSIPAKLSSAFHRTAFNVSIRLIAYLGWPKSLRLSRWVDRCVDRMERRNQRGVSL